MFSFGLIVRALVLNNALYEPQKLYVSGSTFKVTESHKLIVCDKKGDETWICRLFCLQ